MWVLVAIACYRTGTAAPYHYDCQPGVMAARYSTLKACNKEKATVEIPRQRGDSGQTLVQYARCVEPK